MYPSTEGVKEGKRVQCSRSCEHLLGNTENVGLLYRAIKKRNIERSRAVHLPEMKAMCGGDKRGEHHVPGCSSSYSTLHRQAWEKRWIAASGTIFSNTSPPHQHYFQKTLVDMTRVLKDGDVISLAD